LITDIVLLASVIAAVSAGLVAGVFLTFSDFLMKALMAAQPSGSIQVMQIINRKVYGAVFLVLLLGLAALCALLIVYALVAAPPSAARWLGAGGAIYLIGVFLVTVLCNVPMNKRLDIVQPESLAAALYWSNYAQLWTRWNHVRTLASAGAALCFLIAGLMLIRA